MENLGDNKKDLLETRDQEVFSRLGSLGIKFDYYIENSGELVYNFYNVKKLGHAAYLLSTDSKKIVYQALHFKEDKFEEPESKKEVAPEELMQYFADKFPGVDNIIFSCCNPDRAKTFFSDAGGRIIFIGTGSNTYSTWYNYKENVLSSVRNIKR